MFRWSSQVNSVCKRKKCIVELMPVYTYRLRHRVHHHLCQIYIVCMVTVRMGSIPILSVRQSISIDTIMNFNGDGDRDRDGTCKQALKAHSHQVTPW